MVGLYGWHRTSRPDSYGHAFRCTRSVKALFQVVSIAPHQRYSMSGSMLLNEQLICTVRVANLYRIRNSDGININIIQFWVGEWILYEMGKKPLAIILSHCCKRCVYSIPLKYASSNSWADWKDVFLLFKTASSASCFIALILSF